MIDALPSEPNKDSEAATRHLHVRLILGAMAALVIVAAAFAWRITNGPPPVATPVANAAPPAKSSVLEELVEATKALEVSQQQAIDQLQVLQQQLAAQQTETRKSSGEVAALGDKLETLRQSFASIATPAEDADAQQHEKAKPAIAHSRRRAHRLASATRTAAAHR
jgi:septal ring factor EnvC (AmiA/AmiB activator)